MFAMLRSKRVMFLHCKSGGPSASPHLPLALAFLNVGPCHALRPQCLASRLSAASSKLTYALEPSAKANG